jgi:tRNA-binding EMAP/Myf-like protein
MSSDEDEDDFYCGRLTCECGEMSFMPSVDDNDDEGEESTGEPLTDDQKLARMYASDAAAMCLSCGEEIESENFPWRLMFKHFRVGLIESVEPFKNGSKTYMVTTIDVGEGEPLQVVTNGRVKAGQRVVVACEGAVVPAGAGEDEESVVVKKTSIGGKASRGMLCDSPSLRWVGGGKGTAVTVPDSFAVGSLPPIKKPRGAK